jgi:hypothetical protein
MKEKYIEEKIKRWFIFGENKKNRTVDLANSDDSTLCTLPQNEAEKIKSIRDKEIDFVIRLANAFEASNKKDFDAFWYSE